MNPQTYDPQQLHDRWQSLMAETEHLRIRDAASQLKTGEAQLLSTQIGESVTRLRPEFKAIFNALPSLGSVMASTRNQWAVIEKTGQYDNLDIGDHVGLVLDHDIDLRLFMGHFHSVYAVKVPRGKDKTLHSIQFFAKDGTSLHKVYVKKQEGLDAYHQLVASFKSEDQSPVEPRFEIDPKAPPTPDEEIDVAGFQQAWLDLQDTHEFFGLLRKFGVTRTQGFRLAPDNHCWQVPPVESARSIFHQASEKEVSIMVFVPSPGCIEIHTGPVKKIKQMGNWLNVLDPKFNLHLNELGLVSAWVVCKPTEDGIVTSVEFFDRDDNLVMMCFGERKPGIPELTQWRELVDTL